MINDLPAHGVIRSKKSNCSGYPIIQQSPVEKSRSQKPQTVLARFHRIS